MSTEFEYLSYFQSLYTILIFFFPSKTISKMKIAKANFNIVPC